MGTLTIINSVKNKKWIFNSNTIKYDKEFNKYKQSIKDNAKVRTWIVRGEREVRQVHCRNSDFYDKLIRGYKADLYDNCKKCQFYLGHDLQGVLCNFGVDIKEFTFSEDQ